MATLDSPHLWPPLRPTFAMPTGDIGFIVSGEELRRVANDGTGTMGAVYLAMFAGAITQLGTGIVGDYLNGSHQIGHGVVIAYQIGNATTYPLGYRARSLVLGLYNTFQFFASLDTDSNIDKAWMLEADPPVKQFACWLFATNIASLPKVATDADLPGPLSAVVQTQPSGTRHFRQATVFGRGRHARRAWQPACMQSTTKPRSVSHICAVSKCH